MLQDHQKFRYTAFLAMSLNDHDMPVSRSENLRHLILLWLKLLMVSEESHTTYLNCILTDMVNLWLSFFVIFSHLGFLQSFSLQWIKSMDGLHCLCWDHGWHRMAGLFVELYHTELVTRLWGFFQIQWTRYSMGFWNEKSLSWIYIILNLLM